MRNYGQISAPLNQLLKDSFNWTDESTTTFHALREAMMANYTKVFIVETDASDKGIGAVLMQEGHPIAFWRKGLSGKKLGLSTYEKELIAVVLAVLKWRHYLLGRKFIIKTDHQSLKYLPEQRVTTPFQQKWIVKLLGYDYEITYKHGTENKEADALSRREDLFLEHATVNALLTVDSTWLPTIKLSWQTDWALQQLITELEKDPNSHQGFSWENDTLTYKGSLVVGNSPDIRKQLMAAYHSSSMGGHSGVDKTTRRIKMTFY